MKFYKILILSLFFFAACAGSKTKDESNIQSTDNFEMNDTGEIKNINSENFINLLGHSIKSKELHDLMIKAGMNMEPKGDSLFNSLGAKSKNGKGDLLLTFKSYTDYQDEIGEPVFVSDKKANELILTGIDLWSDLEKTGKFISVGLPFKLKQEDDSDVVIRKIGRNPTTKSSIIENQHSWWFMFDEYRVLTTLNNKYQLMWVRIMKLDAQEKEKIQIVKNLNSQTKNIKPSNIEMLLKLRKNLPTERWKREKLEGDDNFTDAGIKATEKALTDFIDNLAEFTKQRKPAEIYKSIENIVVALNKINDEQQGSLIETNEREELCAFIEQCIKATGFKYDDKLDLTSEWREW